jgi:N-acetylglutamate synthase-like GNAT family acetyltransferase
MHIQPFRSEQAEAVSCLIRRNLREVNSRDYSEKFIEDLVEYFSPETLQEKASEQYILVAIDDDGRIIGTAALANFGTAEAPTYYAVSVFVLPEWHREGIGTRLMQAIEAQARALQAQRIAVRAAISAKGFYQKLGYVFEDDEEVLDEHAQYRMVKVLSTLQ